MDNGFRPLPLHYALNNTRERCQIYHYYSLSPLAFYYCIHLVAHLLFQVVLIFKTCDDGGRFIVIEVRLIEWLILR